MPSDATTPLQWRFRKLPSETGNGSATKLTPRQQMVYEFVKSWQFETGGRLPSLATIAKAFKITRSGADNYLRVLKNKGKIEMPEGEIKRTKKVPRDLESCNTLSDVIDLYLFVFSGRPENYENPQLWKDAHKQHFKLESKLEAALRDLIDERGPCVWAGYCWMSQVPVRHGGLILTHVVNAADVRIKVEPEEPVAQEVTVEPTPEKLAGFVSELKA